MNCFEIFEILDVFDPVNRRKILDKLADPAVFQHTSFSLDYFGHQIDGHTENLIDLSLYFLGTYEPNVQKVMKSLLLQKKDSVFLDVGANFGLHSLFCSQFSQTVYAIEPLTAARQRFLDILSKKPQNRIHIFSQALSNRSAEIPFYLPHKKNQGTGALEYNSQFHAPSEVTQVETVTLGQFLERNQIEDVTLMKVDVEGHELEVLSGLTELEDKKLPSIIFEYSPLTHAKVSSFPEVQAFLRSRYQFYYFKTTTDPSCTLLPWNFDWYGNVLALRPDQNEILKDVTT